MTYKPHYLVRKVPGSGQSQPFFEIGRCAFIEGTNFGHLDPKNCFVPVPAVCHWLDGEWREGKAELDSELGANAVNVAVAAHYSNTYQSAITSWQEAFGGQDQLARCAVNLYFECWNVVRYPSNEAEPYKWCQTTSTGMKRMMRTYALLEIGANAFPGRAIVPDPREGHHASCTDQLRVTLMWGGGERSPRNMMAAYLAIRETRGQANLLSQMCLLVMVDPGGQTDKAELLSAIERDSQRITEAVSPNNTQTHLRQHGDVVDVRQGKNLRVLYAGDLLGEVDVARDRMDLEARLSRVIGGEIE